LDGIVGIFLGQVVDYEKVSFPIPRAKREKTDRPTGTLPE